MAILEIKNDLDSFKQSLTRKATTKIPVVKKKPNFEDVNLTTIQAQARTPVFKSVTTPRKYTTPTKKPKIELPKYTPFTQEEVGLLQHQTRLPMALPKSNLTSKAATNTEYALKSNPTAYGFMEGFSPLATKKQLSKQLGQEIDTTGAEDTLGYKVGYGAGLMGQYAITGGIAHTGVRQGLTRMIPQLANQAGRSTVKNVLGTMGASALTDVLTGVPVNTLQAIKESTIGDNVNWNQFAKSFAVNTGIDIVFGGLIEGGIALKSGKKVKTVGDLTNLTKAEAEEFTQKLLPAPEKVALLNEPQKQLTQPVNYVDELGNISNDPNFNAAKNVLQEEPYVKNKIKVTVKRPSGIYEKIDDDWDFGWDGNDINLINGWIEFSKSHGKTPTKLLKSQLNKAQIEIDKAFDEAKDYFLNYQGKGVDLVEMVDLPGRKVRKSLNDEWYSRWYKKNKKAPTKKDKLQIAEEEFMEDIRAASDGNRDGQFVSEELAKRYSFFNKLENMFKKLPDDTINVELRGEDDMSAFIGQETSIVKPDYTKKPFIERVETPKRVYAGELPQGSKLPENTLSKKIIEKKKAEPIILGGKVETPTNIKQPTIAKRTPLKKVEQELPNLETKYVSGLKADTKIPTKLKSVEAELKSLTAEMKVTPPTETQIKRYKQLKAQVKPAKIPAREPVSTVEPVKSTKPTLTPKTEKVASNVTKTEKSYFDTITNVTEKTKAEKRLGENITFVNNKGNLTKATRKEYIEDMAMIDGSQIKTIQKLRTNGGKTFEVNEYRVYKTPNSKEPIKISKYEKDYFDFAKKNQDNVVQSVTPYKKPIKKVDKSLPPKNTTNPIDLVMASSKNAQKGFKESVIDRGLEVKRKFVDSGDTVAIIGKITGDKGLYHSYNKARSSTRSAEHVLGEAQTNIIGDKVGESLKDIFKPIRKKGDGYYNDFQLYLLHKHNVDRMAQGKPVFGEDITADISIAEAKSLLKEYPEFEELAQKIYKFNKNNMQYRVDADLITAEQAKMFEEMYPHYVPTIRAKKSFPQPPKNSKTDVTGKIAQTIKEATGDSSPILPLHESMARQTMQIVTASEKNIFANRLIKNVTPETSRYIQDINVIAKDFNPDDELINAMKGKKESEELKNYFTLFRNGEAYQVKVDEGLFEGLEALTSSNRSTDAIIEAITAGNTMFKQLITGYSPTFLVRNGARDLQDVGIYSKNLREFAIQYPKAIKEMTSNGELWQRYKALGGTGSSFFDYAKGFKKDPTFIRKNTLNKIENLNMEVEQLPRFTEFMATLSKGDGSYDNLLEALYNSADITVNFGRTGTWGKTLNQTFVPFFNPAMQGFDKLARTLKYTKGWKDWTKLTIKATALGITPALINEIVYSDDPDYANLYSRDKDINYLFKLDNNVWIRIPKGRVLSLIGGAAQRTVRLASGDKDAYAGFLKVAKEQVAPISPFESNIVSPILAVQNNKAWHGGTIEPQRLTGSAGLRYDESTTIPAKWLGAKLNYSPKKIDYLVDAYTGIIGDLAIPLTTPKAEVHPFAKAFTIDGATTNRISQDFYDKKTEISESYSDNKDNTSYIQNRYLNKQSDMASELFEEIRTVQNSKLTDVQKRTKVREIRALINVIEKNALDSLPEVEKTTKKLVNKYPDTDDLYREVNREVFGSEYALKMYNKQVYEKAKEAVKASGLGKKVTYEQYYKGYFAQKDKPSDIGKAVALKSENIDTLFVAFDISDKNARIGAAIYENDLSYIYETTYRRIDENNATKSAEKIAIIRQHNPNLTRQQLNILYEAFNVAESIGGYRRQFK